ncbi:MAG TPA: TlpA disulfide reductase family protein [Candidatus Polarisedimenticolia bacterium]|nr:TlpA disulfide reductase family protein [Candidatus Polarisedimenticolia bacterium]
MGRPADRADGRRRRRAGRGRLLVAGLLVVAVGSSGSADQLAVTALVKRLDLVAYRAGTTPPHFSGPTLDARQLSLTDLRAKVVVVTFWASWCAECRPEMPVLEKLHREFASRGLVIVGINAREDKRAVERYATELGLTFPLVLDPAGTNNRLYGVIGIPTTFVIGRDGRAVAFAVGPRAWGSPPARALIESLLAEAAPRAP